MITVVKAIRLSFTALLTAVRVGLALHPGRCAAARRRIVVLVKGLFAKHGSVQRYLCIQLIYILFRRLFYCYQLLAVFVCFGFDVGGIRIQYLPTYQALCHTLVQNFVKYLLGYIIISKASHTVDANGRMIRPFLGQF